MQRPSKTGKSWTRCQPDRHHLCQGGPLVTRGHSCVNDREADRKPNFNDTERLLLLRAIHRPGKAQRRTLAQTSPPAKNNLAPTTEVLRRPNALNPPKSKQDRFDPVLRSHIIRDIVPRSRKLGGGLGCARNRSLTAEAIHFRRKLGYTSPELLGRPLRCAKCANMRSSRVARGESSFQLSQRLAMAERA